MCVREWVGVRILYCITCEHTGNNNNNYKTLTSSTETFLWNSPRCLRLSADESLLYVYDMWGEVAGRLCCGDSPGLLHGSERVSAAASDCRTPA